MSNDVQQNEDGSFTCAMKVSESCEIVWGSEPPSAEFAMLALDLAAAFCLWRIFQ